MIIAIRSFFFLLIFLAFAQIRAQTTAPLQYTISVALDDEGHQLQGYWELDYTNTSTDTLHDFYLHLWPNAYRNRRSPLARQLLRSGDSRFHFAPDSSLGYLTDLAFQVNEKAVTFTTEKEVPDVAYFHLAQALPPGQSMHLSTPFRLKIPESFSRLGHVGQSYQLTQWFPKAAMYDTEGWHPMPYLSYGEYYAPFADFSVSISLAQNYVVAATGVLQNEEEKEWLKSRSRTQPSLNNDDFPASAQTKKTLLFQAENVHDFAWFADKRFRVEQDTLQLPSGRVIDAAVYYPATQKELWQDALSYLKRATRFYTDRVGEYPYPQVSAVHAPFSEGGGMEYPMITLIGWEDDAQALDAVITHEVGHNWFYGVLATNERRYAWMDEGLNYYYEQRYLSQYYREDTNAPSDSLLGTMADYSHRSRQGQLQIVDQASELLTPDNYWLNAYDIPQLAFAQWEALIGKDSFDRAMQNYFQQWKFKHPKPANLQASLEQSSGHDLSWLFDGLLRSTESVDYAIKRLKKEDGKWIVELQNKSQIAAPFPLQFYRKDSLVKEHWQKGFLGTRSLQFPQDDFDALAIDAKLQTLEENRNNNYSKRPLSIRFLTASEQPSRSLLFYSPLVTYNAYDGISPALLLHNFTLPPKRLQWAILPTYGLKSKSLGGSAVAHFQQGLPQGIFQLYAIDAHSQGYHFRNLPNQDVSLSYLRQELSSSLHFRMAPISTQSSQLKLSVLQLRTKTPRFNNEGDLLSLNTQERWIPRLQYQFKNKRMLAPFQWTTTLEHQSFTDVFNRGQRYTKISSELSGKWLYKADHHFFYRLFIGFFPQHSGRNAGSILPGAFSLIPLGNYDYAFDHYYLGRSETDGLLAQQLGRWDGAFKTPIFPGQSLGRSNNFAWAINLAADLPFGPAWLPLRPYLDLGYADDATPLGANLSFQDQFHWNAGLSLEWLDGSVGIYLPVAGSSNLMDRLAERSSYFSRIGFRLVIKDFVPSRFF